MVLGSIPQSSAKKINSVMRYSDLITEGRDAPVYHQMRLGSPKTTTLLSSDVLQAIWTHDIPGIGPVKGHSFSRNPRLEWADMQLIIDQAKLANRYKIIPVDADFVYARLDHPKVKGVSDRHTKPDQNTMAEEFVVGDIKSLHKYLLGIKISVIRQSNPVKLKELLVPVMDYSYKYSITLYIPHSMTIGTGIFDPPTTNSAKTLFADSELQKRYPNGLAITWYDDPKNPDSLLRY